ncbi:amidase signature enzyme [Dothidotthia symphoricarpi CBS 119687]|uniref:Amidase signature enzyme n=1 Tax=Dothidotthia symphoricarpi CBS 119687 TaxID=1392245 RepID=A0A6A6AHN9_9PLEO|nr:amidase signature enzyme [Dothidotthia symphoricarpi CBS 119687]KAF2130417.1 amidase signature enzyme [Dothidotthia symphoricarpi CBS 119687]
MGFLRSLGVVGFVSSVQAAVSSTGFTVSLTDIDYFLPPKPVANIAGCDIIASAFKDADFVPFTVVKVNGTLDIASTTAQYAEQDDVWQEAFLEALYIQGSNQPANSSVTVLTGTTSSELNPGPYFINAAGNVYEAWRLYSDKQGAFFESVIASDGDSYSVLPASTVGQKLAIAVPSRLYFTKTTEKPLAGVRMGIKDIYDIKGLRTSNGNRAWYWFYPPAENTATPVQNLIDAGAVIVGKMVTSQFANGEVATADWVDYHEAFNPRGEGYQDTSSSSSGGGAGEASYPWLDVTLGSDTGGSVRGPSQVQGIYGCRPSHDIVSLEHTMPLSPVLDTAGLLARNPILWKEAAQAMYGSNLTITNTYPTRVQTLAWPTTVTSVSDQLLIDFLGNVTDFLDANATAFNITASFSQDNPTLAPLTTILNLTYPLLITKQQIGLVRDPFYADYAAKYDGRRPFVNPVPLARWGWGANASETVAEAIANKTTFMNWSETTFLAPSAQTCSQSLVMYVGSTGRTSYRNTYLTSPGVPFGFSNSRISVFTEVPDFVVPIGEVAYNSTITGHVEYLPVTVDFMVAKGCDGMLFSLIQDLYEAGIVKESLTGRSGITGGEILLKRGLGY